MQKTSARDLGHVQKSWGSRREVCQIREVPLSSTITLKRSAPFLGIGDNHADEIVCFPNSGKRRVRATDNTVPISSL